MHHVTGSVEMIRTYIGRLGCKRLAHTHLHLDIQVRPMLDGLTTERHELDITLHHLLNKNRHRKLILFHLVTHSNRLFTIGPQYLPYIIDIL